MKKPSNFKVKPKILISLLTLLCVVCLILSAIVPSFSKPFKFATGIMVVPLQEGVNRIGTWFTDKEELMKSVKKLKSENKKLNEKVDELTEENSLLAQNKYELERLRDLYQLDQDYSSYEKIAANVIGKDSGNWFDIFTINKGSKDGIKKDMNVIPAKLENCMQPNLLHPSTIHKYRDAFERDYTHKGLVYVMKKYGDMGWRYKFKILFNKTKKISKLWK